MPELLPGTRCHWGENKTMRDWEPCNLGATGVCLCRRVADAVVSVRELQES